MGTPGIHRISLTSASMLSYVSEYRFKILTARLRAELDASTRRMEATLFPGRFLRNQSMNTADASPCPHPQSTIDTLPDGLLKTPRIAFSICSNFARCMSPYAMRYLLSLSSSSRIVLPCSKTAYARAQSGRGTSAAAAPMTSGNVGASSRDTLSRNAILHTSLYDSLWIYKTRRDFIFAHLWVSTGIIKRDVLARRKNAGESDSSVFRNSPHSDSDFWLCGKARPRQLQSIGIGNCGGLAVFYHCLFWLRIETSCQKSRCRSVRLAIDRSGRHSGFNLLRPFPNHPLE